MDEGTVRMQAKMFAYVAEIEAIKATIKGFETENNLRIGLGQAPLYGENAFFGQNRELRRLAESLRENI